MCLLGKMKLAPISMMLRDETKVKLRITHNQRDSDSFILQTDIDAALEIFNRDYGANGKLGAAMLLDLYSQTHNDVEGKNLSSRIHQMPVLNFRSFWGSRLEEAYMRYTTIMSKMILVIHEVFWAMILRRGLSKKFGSKTEKNSLR